MKHRGLKFLSLLLTLVMVLGMLPGMTAFAADTGTVYLKGETIDTGGNEFFISDRSNAGPSTDIWKGVGSEPVVSSVGMAQAKIRGEYNGEPRDVDVKDTNTTETRIPVGVRIVGYENVTGSTETKKAVKLALVYGFTVTYDPGKGSFNTEAVGQKKIIDGKLVDYEETNAASFNYQIQGYDSYLNAPEGKVFDCSLGHLPLKGKARTRGGVYDLAPFFQREVNV